MLYLGFVDWFCHLGYFGGFTFCACVYLFGLSKHALCMCDKKSYFNVNSIEARMSPLMFIDHECSV